MCCCVGDDIGSKVEVFSASSVRHLNGLEDVVPCQNCVGPVGGDVKRSDTEARAMGGTSGGYWTAMSFSKVIEAYVTCIGDLGDPDYRTQKRHGCPP